MNSSQLARFEELCQNLYGSSGDEQRRAAHDVLMPLLNQSETIPQLEFILANSRNAHALLFASNGLMQLLTQFWVSFGEIQRDELKSFLLAYLAQNCAEMYTDPLKDQAMSFMVRLLCRVVKLSWLEGPKYQTITADVQRMIDSGSTTQAVLAIDIYTALTGEMQPSRGPQMARWRRTAMAFRDVSLASIFQTGMKILQSLFNGKLNVADKNEESRLVHKLLKLVVGSLSFDFMGTMPDETTEDQATVMVPYSWTNVKDLTYPSLFFDLYSTCVRTGRKNCAILCLQALVLFASLRKSLYSKEEERAAMLSSYMRGTSQILANSLGLDDPECYHEFCRLLGRLNAANQLTDLSSNAQFSMWIDQVFAFTASALKRITHLPNSMHYLLAFWSVLVPPVAALGDRAPAQVKQYLEQVLALFVESRLQLGDHDEEDDDETLLMEQLDVVSATSRLFSQHAFDLLCQTLKSATAEPQLVWAVYLLGAVLAGQAENLQPQTRARSASLDTDSTGMVPSKSVSTEYSTVGEIAKQVLSLMAKTECQPVSDQLELAFLYFLEQLKKVFVSEQAKITALVTPRTRTSSLALAIGLNSDSDLIDVFVAKIFFNFQKSGCQSSEPVLKKTLSFFSDLLTSSGIVYLNDTSLRMTEALLRNERVKFALGHLEAINFHRIDKNFNTIYFATVFKLLFAEIALNPTSAFKLTMWRYFDMVFEKIRTTGISARTPDQGKLIVTLARDLKGVSQAATSSDTYDLLFKYLVDNPKNASACKVTLFSAALDVWWDEPQVAVPVLKFIADFAHNRAQRISFDPNSPNGVLLFREAAKVLSVYGQRMLARSDTYRDIYEEKYKGVGAALGLLTNTLAGGYANLGIFELYNDSSLTVSMATALNLCLSIPLNDLAAYLKSLKSFYSFLDLATKSHMSSLLQLGPNRFALILRALEDGMTAFDVAVSLNCCVAIDHACSYLIDTPEGGAEDAVAIQAIVSHPDTIAAFRRLLALMNHLSMSGEFASTWSLSRPFLGLILICKNEFVTLRTSIIDQQPTHARKSHVEKCYSELMKDVNDSLVTKNRETFTKNLYQFGINIRNS